MYTLQLLVFNIFLLLTRAEIAGSEVATTATNSSSGGGGNESAGPGSPGSSLISSTRGNGGGHVSPPPPPPPPFSPRTTPATVHSRDDGILVSCEICNFLAFHLR